MRLIGYEIRKHVENDPNSTLVFVGFYETKIVGKKKYLELKNKGWYLERKKYFVLTDAFDYWSTFNTDQKLKIAATAIASIIALLGIFYKPDSATVDEHSKVTLEPESTPTEFSIQLRNSRVKEASTNIQSVIKDSTVVDSVKLSR